MRLHGGRELAADDINSNADARFGSQGSGGLVNGGRDCARESSTRRVDLRRELHPWGSKARYAWDS